VMQSQCGFSRGGSLMMCEREFFRGQLRRISSIGTGQGVRP
jgi:hypothetical protein